MSCRRSSLRLAPQHEVDGCVDGESMEACVGLIDLEIESNLSRQKAGTSPSRPFRRLVLPTRSGIGRTCSTSNKQPLLNLFNLPWWKWQLVIVSDLNEMT